MGYPVLTAAMLLLFLLSPHPVIARQLCLNCHPVHYAKRGDCVSCHRGNPSSPRKNIAHQRLIAGRYARYTLGDVHETREGARLISQYACRRCHIIARQGNRLSADLDASMQRRAPQEVANAIMKPVQNMPDFRIAEKERDYIVTALLAADASNPESGGVSSPQLLHFNRFATADRDVFSKRCGACHRAITLHLGVVGTGNAGPNLSGLFSEFYPKSSRDGDDWNLPILATWLKNPRAVRPWSPMQPVSLTAGELKDLESILSVGRLR